MKTGLMLALVGVAAVVVTATIRNQLAAPGGPVQAAAKHPVAAGVTPDMAEAVEKAPLQVAAVDFGRFHYRTGEQTKAMTVTNDGNAPVVIRRTETGCGCISVESTMPVTVPARGRATLDLRLDPLKMVAGPPRSVPGAALRGGARRADRRQGPLPLLSRRRSWNRRSS